MHSISLEFPWFFKDLGLDQITRLSTMEQRHTVLENGSSHQVDNGFIKPGRLIEFFLEKQLIYYQLVLPFLFLLRFHFLLQSPLIKGSKRYVRIIVTTEKAEAEFPASIIDFLNSRNIHCSILSTRISGTVATVQLAVKVAKPNDIRKALVVFKGEKQGITTQIIANRCGEVSQASLF